MGTRTHGRISTGKSCIQAGVGLTTVPYTAMAVQNTVLYGYGLYRNRAVLTKSKLMTVR